MFKKLLRYDMMSVWRLWWIGAMIVPFAAVVGGLMPRVIAGIVSREEEMGLFGTLAVIGAGLVMIASILAIFLSFVLTEILVFVRFYKNLFTDEGYLTFTLPVSRKQILGAKTLNAFIWVVLHTILTLVAFGIFALLAPPPTSEYPIINLEIVDNLRMVLADLWDSIGAWTLLIGAELIVWLLVCILMGIVLIQLCITVGSVIAKKAKIIAAIGIYYAVNSVASFVGQMLYYFGLFIVGYGMDAVLPSPTVNQGCGVISLGLLIAICLTGGLTVVLYNITQHLLTRKLNLA